MDVVKRWVFIGIKDFINNPATREVILKSQIAGDNIEYRNCILESNEENENMNKKERLQILDQFVEQINIIPKNKIILATATNFPEGGETHFQTFIIDQKNRIAYAIDPSREDDGESLYEPIMVTDLKQKLKKYGYTTVWAPTPTTGACQRYVSEKIMGEERRYKDVYCQSWSLLSQIDYANKYLAGKPLTKKYAMQLPADDESRWMYLLDFLKSVSKLYCDEFIKSYKRTLKNYKDDYMQQIKDIKRKKRKTKKDLEEINELEEYIEGSENAMKYDPCKIMQSMNIDDLKDSMLEEEWDDERLLRPITPSHAQKTSN